jgi:hypothetical protein
MAVHLAMPTMSPLPLTSEGVLPMLLRVEVREIFRRVSDTTGSKSSDKPRTSDQWAHSPGVAPGRSM